MNKVIRIFAIVFAFFAVHATGSHADGYPYEQWSSAKCFVTCSAEACATNQKRYDDCQDHCIKNENAAKKCFETNKKPWTYTNCFTRCTKSACKENQDLYYSCINNCKGDNEKAISKCKQSREQPRHTGEDEN